MAHDITLTEGAPHQQLEQTHQDTRSRCSRDSKGLQGAGHVHLRFLLPSHRNKKTRARGSSSDSCTSSTACMAAASPPLTSPSRKRDRKRLSITSIASNGVFAVAAASVLPLVVTSKQNPKTNLPTPTSPNKKTTKQQSSPQTSPSQHPTTTCTNNNGDIAVSPAVDSKADTPTTSTTTPGPTRPLASASLRRRTTKPRRTLNRSMSRKRRSRNGAYRHPALQRTDSTDSVFSCISERMAEKIKIWEARDEKRRLSKSGVTDGEKIMVGVDVDEEEEDEAGWITEFEGEIDEVEDEVDRGLEEAERYRLQYCNDAEPIDQSEQSEVGVGGAQDLHGHKQDADFEIQDLLLTSSSPTLDCHLHQRLPPSHDPWESIERPRRRPEQQPQQRRRRRSTEDNLTSHHTLHRSFSFDLSHPSLSRQYLCRSNAEVNNNTQDPADFKQNTEDPINTVSSVLAALALSRRAIARADSNLSISSHTSTRSIASTRTTSSRQSRTSSRSRSWRRRGASSSTSSSRTRFRVRPTRTNTNSSIRSASSLSLFSPEGSSDSLYLSNRLPRSNSLLSRCSSSSSSSRGPGRLRRGMSISARQQHQNRHEGGDGKFLNTYEKLLLELSMDPVISPSTTTGGANSTTTQTKKQSSVVPLWTRGTSIPSSHPPQQPLPAVPPPMYPRGLSSSASATTTTTSASASVLPLYTSQPPAIITRPFTNKNTPTVAKLESLMDEALAFPSVSLTSPVSTSTSPNSALFVSDEDEYSRDDGFDGIDGMVGWSGRNGILDDDDDEEYEDIVDEYVFEHIIQDEEEEDEGREYYRGGGLDSLPPPPPLMDRDAARTPSTLSSAPNTPSLGSYPAPIPFLGATDDFLGFPADEMDPHHPAHNMNKKRDGVVGLGFVDGVDEAHLHHHQQQLSHPPQQHWPNQTHHNNGKKHQNIRRMYSRVRRIIRGTSAPPATRGHHKRSLSVVSVSSSSGGVEVEAGGECAGSAGGVGRGVGGAKRTGFVGVASMPPPSRVPRGSMVTPRGMGYAREIEVVEVEIIPDPTSPKTTTPPSYASNSTSSTKALSTTTFIAGAPFAASVAASQHANQHHMAVAIEAVKAAAVAAASSSDASNNNNNSNSSNAGNVHRPSSTATSTSMRSSWSTIAGGNSAEVNEKKGPSSVTTKHKGGFSRMVSRVKKSVEAITGQHP